MDSSTKLAVLRSLAALPLLALLPLVLATLLVPLRLRPLARRSRRPD